MHRRRRSRAELDLVLNSCENEELLFVFQTLARGLVMWDSVLPSFSYLQDNIPKVGLMVMFL